MNLNNQPYKIGDYVYLKTDPEQKKRMVLEIRLTPNGFRYVLTYDTYEQLFYEIEFSSEKNLLLSLNIEEVKDESK